MLASRTHRRTHLAWWLSALLLSATAPWTLGNGSEVLGPPSITVAGGTGVVTAGIGLENHGGTLNFSVPAGATINQVLVYWGGFNQPSSGSTGPGGSGGGSKKPGKTPIEVAPILGEFGVKYLVIPPDDSLAINGIPITGSLIGGPTHFYNFVEGTTFRAEVTDLGLVSPGPNSLAITGLDFGAETHGASIVVIYSLPHQPPANITIRDGQDLAFYLFSPPLDTTAPQNFAFTPSVISRIASLTIMAGSVAENRPNKILVTVEGTTVPYVDLLGSFQGDQWDNAILSVVIPAGADDLRVQILSAPDATPNNPASLAWISAVLSIPGVALPDCDSNGIPDECELDCTAFGGECGALYPSDCGRISDCNANDLPDVCELTGSDCNENGILDICEPGGGPCDDLNPCTVADSCSNGVCAGTPRDCSSLDSDCTVGACNAQSGLCEALPAHDGADCSDTDACTTNGVCSNGICVSDAVQCDDGNPCTNDSCDPSTGCTFIPSDANTCGDGDVCNGVEECVDGMCEAGAVLTCDDGNPCTDDACDPLLGCTAAFNTNGCDDADACTAHDICSLGLCQGEAITCDDGNPCTDDHCDPAAGCTTSFNTNGCDDDNACTDNDVCASGNCAGAPVTCDDGNPCTDDTCEPLLGCVTIFNTNGCDDDDACTADDVCVQGDCVGVGTVCDDGNPCTDDACDPLTGCTSTFNTNGCDDDDACTADDVCVQGDCVGEGIACDDGNPCTDDACDPLTGCTTTFNTTDCDDDDACTADDVCVQGDCVGEGVVCDDGNPCTDDACDSLTGCTTTFNTNGCDDDDACTQNDICTLGDCLGNPIVCDDGDPCTDDACDPATGCTTAVNTNGCNDNSACTSNDVCSQGVCAGAPITCDDGNPCTDDACDPLTGCTTTFNTNGCDDNSACTRDDVCAQGQCAGTALVCDDGNVCTDDACDPLTGCTTTFNTNGCDDNNACTADDVCSNGACAGDPITCDDGNPCTDDACDAATGCTATPDDSNSCDDGSVCNGVEACQAGQCLPGAALLCDDGDPCTDNLCDALRGCIAQFNTNGCDDTNLCTIHDACHDGDCHGDAVVCPPGWQCNSQDGSCINPIKRRGRVGEKGSILFFSKVDIRWDASGALLQDTFISLVNDYPAPVAVQMYFVNGDAPLAASSAPIEPSHPGWNSVDVQISLTQNQPAYWSAATGLPAGVSPFTVLDASIPPGRPDPDGSSDRVLRGYIVAWAVDAANAEVCWNHLSGEATIVNYRDSSAWTYGAFAHKCVAAGLATGAATGTPGVLNLDDVEYEPGFDLLLLNFFGDGSQALSSGAYTTVVTSHLTLQPLDADLRQETAGPVTTKATFTVWNENEAKLTGMDLCITCWDQRMFARYGIPNHLLRVNLQTDQGKAQIDALPSQLCNVDYDPADGKPLGGDPRDRVSRATPLIGVEAKRLALLGGPTFDEAGTSLVGMGRQNAVIRYDVTAPPPELLTVPQENAEP
jgi:hypothetical protein